MALDLSLSTRMYTQLTHSTHADMHTDICCLTVISRTVSVESYSNHVRHTLALTHSSGARENSQEAELEMRIAKNIQQDYLHNTQKHFFFECVCVTVTFVRIRANASTQISKEPNGITK